MYLIIRIKLNLRIKYRYIRESYIKLINRKSYEKKKKFPWQIN